MKLFSSLYNAMHYATSRFLFLQPKLNGSLFDGRRESCSKVMDQFNSNGEDIRLDNKDYLQRKFMEAEMCILVNENDQVTGKASKKDCHLMENIDKGMLHRAFSVLIFNTKGECLLTQRAASKITFPNYYTNACCSHPLYNELELDTEDALGVKRAAQRRLQMELGISPLEVPLDQLHYITRILYKAPSDGNVWGEHEVDYILILNKDVQIKPNENEVQSCKYLNKQEFQLAIEKAKSENLVTPWFAGIHDQFLYNWWENLDNLDSLKEHKTIFHL